MGFLWGLLINIMTVSFRHYLLFMTKINDHNYGCILPTNVVDIIICYISIRLAQNATQTLIGKDLKQRQLSSTFQPADAAA